MTREFAILKAANDYRDAENMIEAVLVELRSLNTTGWTDPDFDENYRTVERWYDLAWDAQSVAKSSLLAFAVSA